MTNNMTQNSCRIDCHADKQESRHVVPGMAADEKLANTKQKIPMLKSKRTIFISTFNVQTLKRTAKSNKKFSGHIWRHDEELGHNLLFWMPTNGKSKRGRRQKTYIDQLIEDTGLQLEERKTLMANREEWKSFINSNFPKRFHQ